MKALTVLITAAIAKLAASQGSALAPGTGPEPPSSSAPSSAGTSSVPSSGIGTCYVGYTYCGYILEKQGFSNDAITQAYRDGRPDHWVNNAPTTNPMQGLFVCLPADASPKGKRQAQTKGGKIEMLCACNGTSSDETTTTGCLNPNGDHIGRCASSCTN